MVFGTSSRYNGWRLILQMCVVIFLVDEVSRVESLTETNPFPAPAAAPAAATQDKEESLFDKVTQEMLDSEQPAIFTDEDQSRFTSKLHNDRVVSLKFGCGRGKNRLGMLSDGTKFCCRYRQLQWREIRGDFYAYHLNNLLGMYNAPPATLVKLNYSTPQWSGVADQAREAGWQDHMTVLVTMYVEEELVGEALPSVLAESSAIVTREYVRSVSADERSRVLQWSNLIVFDFLTGHCDRIFNTLCNLQWNSRMLQKPVHNLLKTKSGKKLLLFDNESGFWMGYKVGRQDSSKYEMQERFLKRMCVFTGRTLEQLEYLTHGNRERGTDESESPVQRLEQYIKQKDSKSFQMIETLGQEQKQDFESRLRLVMEQVEKCTRL